MNTDNLPNRLGKIILNFSTLELLVSSFVSRLIIEDSKIGAIVTSEMAFRNLLNAFDSLMKYKYSTDNHIFERWNSLKTRLNNNEQIRNIYIHSVYGLKENGQELYRLKTTAKQNKGLITSNEIITIESLKKIINEQVSLIKDLEALHIKLYPNEEIKYA